ncbi:MAG: dTDP-4-amino-4,6-dideoxygalactose transaminase [Rhodospirillaceae bacterium]|nr:dTDP-4-amino-4,6-dideoxygalactose transaminase [Rhodospirillaceae bacterium]
MPLIKDTVPPPIPLNRSSLQGNELSYVQEAVSTGHSASKGPFSNRVADLLRTELEAADILLTTSCTTALELSAMLLNVQPGFNVIVPSYAFVTTASAFARSGAELRFADIDPVSLCIDPDSVGALIDSSTRAIVPVHYGGMAADIDRLTQLIEVHGDSNIVEDNAHGLFGSHGDSPLGSFGRFSTLSFHETKNFSCGEGGALVINEKRDVARAHTLYDKGTNRAAFLDGRVDRYTWIEQGSSFGMSDLLAAFLLGQIEQRTGVMGRRQKLFTRYHKQLSPLEAGLGIEVPPISETHRSAYHTFYVLVSGEGRRDAVLQELNESGIGAPFHYQPLHRSEGAQPWVKRKFDCPISDSVSNRIIRLPFFDALTDSEFNRVAETLTGALRHTA